MDAESAYDKFRAAVKAKAANIKRPLEISQSALWAKSVIVEALADKSDGLYTFRAGDKFGFSELLVNQCIEFAMRYDLDCMVDEAAIKEAYARGYDDARIEFAKATGLYTEDDLP